MNIKKSTKLLLIISLLFLSACGGSGSDPSAEVNDETNAAEITQVMGNSIELVSVETLARIPDGLESPHATHLPLQTIPASGRVMVLVRFLTKPSDLQIYLVDNESNSEPETLVEFAPESLDAEYTYFGEFDAPLGEFSYKLVGNKPDGDSFSVLTGRNYP